MNRPPIRSYRLACSACRIGFAALLLFAGTAPPPRRRQFHDLQVEVIGKGRPVLMIPGLNSGADTWRDTCDGPAGRPGAVPPRAAAGLRRPAGGEPSPAAATFLADMRDRLLAYVKARKLTGRRS